MNFVRANFTDEQILDVLNLYPFSLENISITKLTGIANDNYRVRGKQLDIALKAYSHGQSDEKKITKELEAQQVFEKDGIKVPKLLLGNNNEVLQKYKGFSVSASEFITGIVFDKVDFTKERMFMVGELVAEVESISKKLDVSSFESMSFQEEFDFVSQNFETEMATKKYNFDLTGYKKNLKHINKVINELDDCESPQFLHKDIWPWNLIETKDGIYLLDFNDWAVGAPIIELSVPLLEFSMFKSEKFNYDVAKNIVEGYKSIKPIKYTPQKLWESLLFVCYLYFPYNVIQSSNPEDSKIYLKRIDTLLKNPDMLNNLL